MRSRVGLIIAVLGLCVLLGWTSYGQRQRPSLSRFEYKIVYVPGVHDMAEKTLNELGSQGWELVSFQQINLEGRTIGAGNYYFKRARQ